jgi:hypothetical protein
MSLLFVVSFGVCLVFLSNVFSILAWCVEAVRLLLAHFAFPGGEYVFCAQ